ncbi:hypothetical protein J1N35_041222 [Gossypium stocksii]|uniref:Uncharacterized protein n=1 Tax=Gossypium stocksii TaxID=47602 RepID=A0A9D3ZJI2_9ROSI|nr:hypothetical protein J1N35_041222 [Gossypium stocksii]
MCLVHSIIKGRRIDVSVIHHQEIAECTARKTNILVFPSLIMSLCQQRGIVPWGDKEIMDNNGPINEASFKRMTRAIETPILQETETSKTKKGKAKAVSKGTTLHTETSLWRKMKDVEKWLLPSTLGKSNLLLQLRT